jgi:hypothetical protein
MDPRPIGNVVVDRHRNNRNVQAHIFQDLLVAKIYIDIGARPAILFQRDQEGRFSARSGLSPRRGKSNFLCFYRTAEYSGGDICSLGRCPSQSF